MPVLLKQKLLNPVVSAVWSLGRVTNFKRSLVTGQTTLTPHTPKSEDRPDRQQPSAICTSHRNFSGPTQRLVMVEVDVDEGER